MTRDEPLLAAMLRVLLTDGKRAADTFRHRWNRVTEHMHELERMADAPNHVFYEGGWHQGRAGR